MSIEEKKIEFMSAYWVEDRHQYLKTLPESEAKAVLDALEEHDAILNVNLRESQADYIADFLTDIWQINRDSFWEHIVVACQHQDGLVLADHQQHIDPLRTGDIPTEVWLGLLWTLTKSKSNWGGYGDYMKEVLASIISYQTQKASLKEERKNQLCDWYHSLNTDEVLAVTATLKTSFGGTIPEWLS